MTLGKFILHLKHKSISIRILDYESGMFIYNGSVGGYFNWIYRSDYNKSLINRIQFSNNGVMLIYLEGE